MTVLSALMCEDRVTKNGAGGDGHKKEEGKRGIGERMRVTGNEEKENPAKSAKKKKGSTHAAKIQPLHCMVRIYPSKLYETAIVAAHTKWVK